MHCDDNHDDYNDNNVWGHKYCDFKRYEYDDLYENLKTIDENRR